MLHALSLLKPEPESESHTEEVEFCAAYTVEAGG